MGVVDQISGQADTSKFISDVKKAWQEAPDEEFSKFTDQDIVRASTFFFFSFFKRLLTPCSSGATGSSNGPDSPFEHTSQAAPVGRQV